MLWWSRAAKRSGPSLLIVRPSAHPGTARDSESWAPEPLNQNHSITRWPRDSYAHGGLRSTAVDKLGRRVDSAWCMFGETFQLDLEG